MKSTFLTLGLLSAAFLLTGLTACQTDSSPGASDTLGVVSTNVTGPTDKVTKAAQNACSDLKLTNIVASGTMVDGKVTANDAQGDAITIDIEQNGDNVSKVSVHVGLTGDADLSNQLIARINKDL
ncbi:MAG: DUF3568 family protein [Tepidisphaeraceae bacterium]|jgi:hypothetical protein